MNGAKKSRRLAIVSLVLGILSVVSLVFGILSMPLLRLLAGIPAIIAGVIASWRTHKLPEQYGGAGFAIAGLVMGCVSLLVTAAIVAKEREEGLSVNCSYNLKAIALCARLYATDYHNIFPANFLQMSNELATPKALICPCDKARNRRPASQPLRWDPMNITYEFLTPGLEVNATNLQKVAFRCPIHGHECQVDGSIRYGKGPPRAR